MRGKYIKQNKGAATLELLIAFAILIINITAVMLLISGGQSIYVDSETNSEALSFTQQRIEQARGETETNFNSIVSSPIGGINITSGPITYKATDIVTDFSPCLKQLSTQLDYKSESRTQYVSLVTLIGSVTEALALGGDCSIEPLGGGADWDNPITATSVGIGGQGATDIDVHNNFIYLTSAPSAASKEDFFIYQFDPVVITLTEKSKMNVSKGLNAVDVINDYAFTANNETSNNLKIFNISNPTSPSVIASVSLPGMTVGIARSIFYYNNNVYIGTQYLACLSCSPQQNNEFHVFDVSNPASPVWRGSFKVNHNINSIVVRNNYAYLATSDNNGEIRIYDISDPANISLTGLFNAPGNENGESLFLLGNKLYLGRDRTPAARKDFYILDISNPASPTELGSKNLGLNPNTVVVGVVVKGNLAFLALDNPTSGLQILNISNPSNIVKHTVCTTLNFSENSTALDMEGDVIFSANKSNNEIRVIKDQTSTCP